MERSAEADTNIVRDEHCKYDNLSGIYFLEINFKICEKNQLLNLQSELSLIDFLLKNIPLNPPTFLKIKKTIRLNNNHANLSRVNLP